MAATALQLNPEPKVIERYQSKVQELTDVVTSYSTRFHRIALGQLGNAADADDAVQDALLSAWKHVDQFKGEAKLSTWLTTIVVNSARMELRRRVSKVQMALDETDGGQNVSVAEILPETRPDPEQVYRKREIAKALAHATSQLSPILRRTFELRDIEGLSIRETAHRLGVPAGTVKARLARARRRLKEVIPKSFREGVSRSNAKVQFCS